MPSASAAAPRPRRTVRASTHSTTDALASAPGARSRSRDEGASHPVDAPLPDTPTRSPGHAPAWALAFLRTALCLQNRHNAALVRDSSDSLVSSAFSGFHKLRDGLCNRGFDATVQAASLASVQTAPVVPRTASSHDQSDASEGGKSHGHPVLSERSRIAARHGRKKHDPSLHPQHRVELNDGQEC